MVLALGAEGPPWWQLDGMLGGELWECPLEPPWAGVWEWCLELFLDLLGLDALHWPLCTELSFPPNEAPQSTPGSSKRPVYMAGSGLHHCSPCKCVVEASQHGTPWVVSWKLRPQAHQQCPIIDCPCEAFKMAGVIYIQQGQGIWHALLLEPMLLLGAQQCREA